MSTQQTRSRACSPFNLGPVGIGPAGLPLVLRVMLLGLGAYLEVPMGAVLEERAVMVIHSVTAR